MKMVNLAELRGIVESLRTQGLTYTTLKIEDVLAVIAEAERARATQIAASQIGKDAGLWEGLRPAVRARLAMAVEHVMHTGSLNRADIMRIGEVTAAQASHDLTQIIRRCPDLLRYDTSLKRYVLAEDRPGA